MIEFIIACAIGISLFVFIYLIKHNGFKLVSRRIAMAIQLLWMARFALFYLKPDTEPCYNAALIVYDQTLFFLDGLLVWLYVRALLKPEKGFRRIWLHFIPFIFVFLYSTWALIFRSEEVVQQYNQNVELLLNNQNEPRIPELIFMTVLVGLNIYYLIRSVRITNSYNNRLKENLSTIDHLTINWIKIFQNLWVALFVIPLTIFFINTQYRFMEHLSLGYLTVYTFVLLSVVFNFYLLEQVYKPVSLFDKNAIRSNSGSEAHQDELFKKLTSLMDEHQYYLNEELSLSQLADYMDLKPAELTEVIKFSPYENFYDLVNSYRVEAVKKELLNSKDQIIQLAYQNGFRSKSTFNKIFKDKTGMTPKAYRVSLK